LQLQEEQEPPRVIYFLSNYFLLIRPRHLEILPVYRCWA
jgi:hypothetical protein